MENCTTSDAGILMCIFHYCFKKKWNMKEKKIIWNTLLHIRHQVWHQFGSLWVRGVHWHPLEPHLTPGCPLTRLNLLKVPAKIPWFRNVSKASSVTPILKPRGQGSSLAPLRTTFDTWLAPGPLKPPEGAHWNHLILEMSVRHQVWHQFGSLWGRGVHWRPLGPHLTPGCLLGPLNLLKVPPETTWLD